MIPGNQSGKDTSETMISFIEILDIPLRLPNLELHTSS